MRRALFLALSIAMAAVAMPTSFADGPAHGWFWYQVPPPPPAKAASKPVVAKPVQAASKPKPPAKPASAPQPKVLSVEWLSKHLEAARIKAIDNPTTENVGAYLALQKIMFDKARNFAQAGQRALRKYPALNPGTFVPTDASSLRDFDAYKNQVRPVALKYVFQHAGLWFFFDSTCVFCGQEALQLGQMRRDFPGLYILPISVDHKPLPGFNKPGDFWVSDYGQAQRLKISLYPTVVLVWPHNHFAYVAQGEENEEVIESNILQVAAEHQLLPATYASWVRPYERGVLTPLQIQDATKQDMSSNQNILNFVTRSAYEQSSR